MRARLGIVSTAVAIIALGMFADDDGPQPGGSLPGISSYELELFRLGRADFMEQETAEDGLGPAFNGTSCAQCHSTPAVGGASTIVETRAGTRAEDGTFSAPKGGTLHHLFSIAPHDCQVSIYEDANVIARRISVPLFGAGLIEAVPDETLLALADPEDLNGDGIRGRAAIVEDLETGRPRVGRFGWKAQHATLISFAADAYRNEMGITNDLLPDEMSADGDAIRLHRCDGSADPEDIRDPRTGMRGIDNFANFLKFLAPVGRRITPEGVRGEKIFYEVGCGSCHVPLLHTGPSSNRVFDRKPVPLFSDLLLHDIGTGDGIEQEAAKGNEFRTPALWGLRLRRPLLHDGSAATVEDAIRRHQVEAASVTARFSDLSKANRDDLLAFLRSL